MGLGENGRVGCADAEFIERNISTEMKMKRGGYRRKKRGRGKARRKGKTCVHSRLRASERARSSLTASKGKLLWLFFILD